MNETRQEKFKRLASQRTNATLDKLRLIGNLSNKSNYDYSDADIKKIFNAIDTQLKGVKSKFLSKNRQEFKL
ncbi:hypothetical protein HY612_00570 [Candidatus Roizmanbacteria bacterium]|nr:hypothetical protein [Candidatus Roizmanbacteria bacterium]